MAEKHFDPLLGYPNRRVGRPTRIAFAVDDTDDVANLRIIEKVWAEISAITISSSSIQLGTLTVVGSLTVSNNVTSSNVQIGALTVAGLLANVATVTSSSVQLGNTTVTGVLSVAPSTVTISSSSIQLGNLTVHFVCSVTDREEYPHVLYTIIKTDEWVSVGNYKAVYTNTTTSSVKTLVDSYSSDLESLVSTYSSEIENISTHRGELEQLVRLNTLIT